MAARQAARLRAVGSVPAARLRAAPSVPAGSRGDHGAAVVDFVLISVLLVFLLFAVLQVAVYCYVRNIVAASAADAARYAANAGVDPAAGGQRAGELIREGIGAGQAGLIPCRGSTATDSTSGLAVATVHCRGRLKVTFLPLDLPLRIDVTSSSLKEGTP
ncbi:MAG: pilus assembly protein TadE [Pseudonocardiales bacterium]|nr:MAG: pilus assembly protein TadE [Pseudonocardiales bacterium]